MPKKIPTEKSPLVAPNGAAVEPPAPVQKVRYRELYRFADGTDKVLILVGSIGSIVAGAVMPAFSFFFGQLINSLAGDPSTVGDEVSKYALYIVFAAAAILIGGTAEVGAWSVSAERQNRKLRQAYFSALLRQEAGWFDKHQTGEVSSRLDSDTQLVVEAIGSNVGRFQHQMATCVLGFAYGFYQSWRMTLVLLSTTPLLVICGIIMGVLLKRMTTKGQDAYAKAGGVAHEVLAAIRTVTAFNGQRREQTRYGVNLETARASGVKKGITAGIGMGVTMGVLFSTYALAFYYANFLVRNGHGNGGEVVAVFFAVVMAAFGLGTALPVLATFSSGQGAAHRIFEVIDRVPEVRSIPGTQPLDRFSGRLEFRDVKFVYPSRTEAQIFDGLNLVVEPGQVIALAGDSGCGKSSIVSLLERFYEPQAGRILVDGINIRDIPLSWWRQQIGIVTQEPTLFSCSIMDNVRYGCLGVTDEQVIQACKEAQIHDTIMRLPDKYNTQVGEQGSQMSGGQKQRIAIARAIVRNPRILLLDEATSALDRKSEMQVQAALDNVMRGRTVIIIAHRLVTIQRADQIYFLRRDEGDRPGTRVATRVEEQGTHQQLLDAQGAYAEMVKAQIRQQSESSAQVDDGDELLIQTSLDPTRAESMKKTGSELVPGKIEEEVKPVPAGRIARLSSGELHIVLLAVFASACTGCVFPAYAMILSEVVSALYKPDDGTAVLWCFFFLALGLWTFAFNTLKMGCFSVAGERLTARLRAALFAAILRQDIGFFDRKEHETGSLCTRLSGDTEKVHTLFGPLIATQIESIFTLGAGLGIAIWASPLLTAVCCAAVPFMVIAGYLNMKYVKGFAAVSTKKYSEAGQVASESIMNVKIVQAYSLEGTVEQRYSDLLAAPEREGIKSGALGGFFFGLGQFITQCTFALTFWVGGQLVKNGDLDLLGVMKCAMAIMFSAMGLGQVQSFQTKISEAKVSTAKVFSILDRQPPIDVNNESGSRDIPSEVSVNFDNISFAYPNRDAMVLRKFSFFAKAGTQTAIIGDTGCGKSTVLALLQRFYDPLSGTVTVNGADLRSFHLRSWREVIGIVSQEPVLFDDTVMENIRYGKPSATDEEVREAARIAQIDDVIMQLPDQYNTILGERGSQLSGGQKQRVAIARAVVRRPRVLLLDEATSALDSKSEIEVRSALEHIVATLRMTVIVIAHRLTTIEGVDTIVVVKAGKVAEAGSHSDLLARGGEYAKRYYQYHSS